MHPLRARDPFDRDRLSAFAIRRFGLDEGCVDLAIQPLRGGLESRSVARVRAQITDRNGRRRSVTFVVKYLAGSAQREIDAYRSLPHSSAPAVPRLIGSELLDDGVSYMYLENVTRWRRWPWRDAAVAAQVLD